MKDTRTQPAAIPATKKKATTKSPKNEQTELSPEALDKVSGGIRRTVKVVNGKKY